MSDELDVIYPTRNVEHEDAFSDDEGGGNPGEYNMETVICGKSTLSLERPVPVFGMRHTSFQGADPTADFLEPRSKKLTESEVRELILRHGLDTQGFIAELRNLVRLGGIPMTPDNIKKIVEAEKGNAEVLLRALDVDNKMNMGDNKTIALQIINHVTNIADTGFTRANRKMREEPVIEASVVAVKGVEEAARKLIDVTPESQILKPSLPTDDIESYVAARRA